MSRLVSHPLQLMTVTVVHVPDQPVVIVTSCRTFSVVTLSACPAHFKVNVLEPPPPLYA